MAIAFDVSTLGAEYALSGTQTTSHVAASNAKAVVVLVHQNALNGNQISGITYGGTAMKMVQVVGESTEPGTIWLWFLNNIKGGTQNVAMTTTGTATKRLVAATMTCSDDAMVQIANWNWGEATSSANPTWNITALPVGTKLEAFEVIHSGTDTMPATADTGWTIIHSADLGTQGRGYARQSIASSTSSLQCGWDDAVADDWVGSSIAFHEVATSMAPVPDGPQIFAPWQRGPKAPLGRLYPFPMGDVVTSEAFVGTAALSGDGSLTVTGTPAITGAVAVLGGSGSLTTAATVQAAGTASLAGSGALTSTATIQTLGIATLSGSGTLATTAVPGILGTATLSGAGALSTTAVPGILAALSLSGSGTLAAGFTPRPISSAAFTGSGTLAAVGTVPTQNETGIAALTGSGTLDAGGTSGPAAETPMTEELQFALRRVSGTLLDSQGAANVWAGTTDLDLVGALNAKAGTVGVDLQGVCNILAFTPGAGVGIDACAAQFTEPYNLPNLELALDAGRINGANYVASNLCSDPTWTSVGKTFPGTVEIIGAAINAKKGHQYTFTLAYNVLDPTTNIYQMYIGPGGGGGLVKNFPSSGSGVLSNTYTAVADEPILLTAYTIAPTGKTVLSNPVAIDIGADGGTVAQWNDLSGKGRHVTQAVGANQPLFRKANRNLLSYASATCETAAYISGTGGATFSDETASPINGIKSAKMTSTSTVAFQSSITSVSTNSAPITPGQTISAQVKFKATTGRTVFCYILYMNASFVYVSDIGASVVATGSTQTLKLENKVVPSNCAWAYIIIQQGIAGTIVGDTLVWDDVQIEAGSVATPWVPPVTLPNNQPTIQFDGLDVLASTGALMYPDHTYYIVAKTDVVTAGARLVGMRSTQGTWLEILNATSLGAYAYQSGAWPSAVGTIDYTTNSVMSGVFTSAAPIKLSINGTVTTGGIYTYISESANIQIGKHGGGNDYPGSIAAVLVFSVAHDDATRKRIEKALGLKYGITVA